MPKFWAKDHLADALRERRAVVERMSLAPPTHMEIVDCYAHKGEVDDVQCSMPWLLVPPDPDFNLHSHLLSASSLLPLVHSDLQKMKERVGSWSVGHVVSGDPAQGVERYGWDLESGSERSLFSDNEDGERGASSFSLTQEIDSAVERVTTSGVGGRSLNIAGATGDEFPPENLEGWERNTSTEEAELCLEELESPPHLSSLLAALPGVSDLVARLKPKLISDPLLDPSTGKMYTYPQLSRSDLELSETDLIVGEAPLIGDVDESLSIAVPHELEKFSQEVVMDISDDTDPVLELQSPPEPLLQSSPSDSLLPPFPPLPSPIGEEGGEEEGEEEGGGEMKDTTLKPGEEELGMLVGRVREESEKREEQQLHFTSSPVEVEAGGEVATGATITITAAHEFLKLNDADVSRDSQDSGIGHAVLESPCVPLSSPRPPDHTSSPSLTGQLARLQPIPVSPNSPHTLVLLSPDSKERFLAQLLEESRTFDSILALTLPYTCFSNHLDTILKSYKPVEMTKENYDVQPINLTGDSELVLPWDPLASSYQLMSAAQRAVVCLQCPLARVDGETPAKLAEIAESFVKDDSVGTQLADTAISFGEGDVPSIHAAPTGYLKGRTVPVPKSASEIRPVAQAAASEKRQREQSFLSKDDSLSAVDLFIMMRTGTLSPEITKKLSSDKTEKGMESEPVTVSEKNHQPWITSSTVQDVHLNREYQAILSKVEGHATPLMEGLGRHGLVMARGASFATLDPEDVKFFLKQQQKCLADSQGSKEEGVLLQSCKLAACLYVLTSFADATANINLTTGLRTLTYLCEKYEELIGSSLDVLKETLADIQLRGSEEQSWHHPKLQSLTSILSTWSTGTRIHPQEKAIVVAGNGFPTVSGDILDFLKSISGLKSCVFSFACESPNNPLYLETLEERFNYYDCLVMPVSSITVSFPWEKVGLLVEYHPLGSSLLFPGGQQPASARLREWVALKTVHDPSPVQPGSSPSMAFQYTLIVSENVASNSKLLQLLESRYNLVLVSREYERLRIKMGVGLSYADLIIDQSTGVIVQPLSVLSSDPGTHTVSTRVAALSLQYERLWILLYAESENSYPYGGSIPLNLARLHASVAHYSTREDGYQVKVLCVSGREEAASQVRSIVEDTQRQDGGMNERYWRDREWISDNLEKHEKFLLSFPCLNSFSAQLMLRGCSLRRLLRLEEGQLVELFPWLPLKVVKFFARMCGVSFQPNLSTTNLDWSERSTNSGLHYHEEPPTATICLDDSLQYSGDDGYQAEQGREDGAYTALQEPEEPIQYMCWDDDDGMQGITPYPPADDGLPATNEITDTQDGTETREVVGSEFFLPPNHSPVIQEPELGDIFGRNAVRLGQTSQLCSTGPPPSIESPYLSLFDPATIKSPSQRDGSPSQFVLPDDIYKEYYGGDPSGPILLTSGMVRRAAPSREPIKSLDLDLGGGANAPKHALPRLQANDRAAALSMEGGGDYDARRKGSQRPESASGVRVQGVEDLMAFHSRQSVGKGESEITYNRPSVSGSRISRQKRPFPRSPLIDCRVPTHPVSPHTAGDTSLYTSPNMSFGSFKLSPLRKKRLVYRKLPSSSDGQTKLAFE